MEVYYMKMRRNEYKESSRKKSGFFLRPGKKKLKKLFGRNDKDG